MYILVLSVIIENKHLKHSKKFIFSNIMLHVGLLLEMNLGENVEGALSKFFSAVRAG